MVPMVCPRLDPFKVSWIWIIAFSSFSHHLEAFSHLRNFFGRFGKVPLFFRVYPSQTILTYGFRSAYHRNWAKIHRIRSDSGRILSYSSDIWIRIRHLELRSEYRWTYTEIIWNQQNLIEREWPGYVMHQLMYDEWSVLTRSCRMSVVDRWAHIRIRVSSYCYQTVKLLPRSNNRN